MKIQEHVGLAEFTTFGVGGPARWFVQATSEAEIVEAVTWARQRKVPLFVLGGGSNLLVSDRGFDGLVLQVALRGIEINDSVEKAIKYERKFRIFRVAAGENWDELVTLAVEQDCAGIECLAGIPGTAGGTPVQNVGAYGQEVADVISGVRVLELETLRYLEKNAKECGFAYRTSIFNSAARGQYLVTRVDYRLQVNGKPNLRYADLQRVFEAEAMPNLKAVAEAVRVIRRSKGMLLVDGDVDCRSAGSFFKNPIIDDEQLSGMVDRLGLEPPHYPGGVGRVKLPAAWLVEQAGFAKGFALGQAAISSKHTLALVNRGGATAREILALRDLIVSRVRGKFGLELEMEPVVVGSTEVARMEPKD